MQPSLILLCCVIVQAPAEHAPSSRPSPDHQLAEYLLRGWKTEREKVYCGSFRLTSEFHEIDPEGNPTGKALRPFANATSLVIRFDRAKEFEEQVAFVGTEVGGYHALVSDGRIFAPSLEARVVSYYPREDRPHLLTEKCVFDWRAVGCFDTSGMEIDSHNAEYFLERFDFVRLMDVTEGDAPGLYVMEIWSRSNAANWEGTKVERITFDESAGFSIRSRIARFCRKGEEANVDRDGPYGLGVTCDWEQKDDVWIPTRVHFDEPAYGQRGVVTLDWQHVNDCCSTEDISLEGSALPDYVLITDGRVAGGPVDHNRTSGRAAISKAHDSTRSPRAPHPVSCALVVDLERCGVGCPCNRLGMASISRQASALEQWSAGHPPGWLGTR
jgi:hypothetical protein